MEFTIKETEMVKVDQENDKVNPHAATFNIEPLLPGHGVTLGNSLRRVLIGSLSGTAITNISINEVNHEFSTIKGMREDVLELILNLKGLCFRLPEKVNVAELKLVKKGPGEITGQDFQINSECTVVNPDCFLATLDKTGQISLTITVERGRGYISAEQQKKSSLPLGTIVVDSSFTPVHKVDFKVEQTRVGGITNFDKLTIIVATNGTITPQQAVKSAAKILTEHFQLIDEMIEEQKVTKIKKSTKKK